MSVRSAPSLKSHTVQSLKCMSLGEACGEPCLASYSMSWNSEGDEIWVKMIERTSHFG